MISVNAAESVTGLVSRKIHYSRYLGSGTLTVVASFDGSKEIERWKDILQFASSQTVKFTFFVIGVCFLPDTEKAAYRYPPDPAKRGCSDIGFGGCSTDVYKRKTYVVKAIREGHDVESHLNGHFPAKKWNEAAWKGEFSQFNKMMDFLPLKIHHVRFPLLEMNKDVYPALAENGIHSVMSVVDDDFDYFSRDTFEYNGKEFTVIKFPIPFGYESRSRVLLMDYNFYLFNKLRRYDAKRSEEAMIKTYMKEAELCFKQRRPLFISHHFTNWKNGVYWEAMKKLIIQLKAKYRTRFITVDDLYQTIITERNK